MTLVLAASLLSCEKQPSPEPEPVKPSVELRKLTLTASLPSLTKTTLQDGEKVLWLPGDKISVFCGTAQAEFTSTNTEPAATASFEGYIEVPSNVVNDQLTLYGVYPYSAANSIDDGTISVALPSEQPALAGSFADDLSISAAKSTGTSMTFYNVCGMVEVSVTRSDVKSVSIQGLNNEDLAGSLSVSFGTDGIPAVQSISDGEKTVSVAAGEEDYLTPGQTYYIVLAPALLAQGVKIGVETDEALMIKKIEKELEVKRSVIGVLSNVDDGALPEFVPFADANFKAYCVENFDTDDDGEISLAEAQEVTSIDCHNLGITSLNGIKYFTNLTSLICSENEIESFDVSNNSLLTELDCSYNQLLSLDVSNNTSLAQVWCERNQLSALDVSILPSLTLLQIDYNQISSLDITNNTALTELHCAYNQLSSLDVSNNTSLTQLHCDVNRLATLDVTSNTLLEYFNCSYNRLTSINVTNNTLLIDFACSANQLTTIDISNNLQLEHYDCQSNQLTSMDVSNHLNMTYLVCTGNLIDVVYVAMGQAFDVIDIPEGAQLIQRGGGTTEDFTRENW